jgi:hypothetical protein
MVERLEQRCLASGTHFFNSDGYNAVTNWTSPTAGRGFVIPPWELADPTALPQLSAWHVNLLRVELVFKGADYTSWINSQISLINNALPALKADGIGIIVDMHDPVGDPQIFSGDTAEPLFKDPGVRQQFYASWKQLASAFAATPQVVGFDILNEPRPEDGKVGYKTADFNNWNSIAKQTVQTIRSAGGLNSSRTVIVEPVRGNLVYLGNLRPSDFSGQNVEYSFHYYGPGAFANFGTAANTHETLTTADTKEIDSKLASVRTWQQKYGVRLYVGEFNAQAWENSTQHDPSSGARIGALAKFLSVMTQKFEQYGWDWTVHAFREDDRWNLEKNFGTATGPGSPWAQSTLLSRFATDKPLVGIPAAPSSGNPGATNQNQIILYWKDNSNNENNFQIYWGTDGVHYSHLVDAPENATSISIGGLSPSSTYYYEVRAVNVAGASAFSKLPAVHTPAAPIVTTDPYNVSAFWLNATTLRVTWSYDKPAQDFLFENGAGTLWLDKTSGTARQFDIGGLDASSSFGLRLLCHGVDGTYSGGVAIGPGNVLGPADPVNVVGKWVTASSFQITWDETMPVKNYLIEVRVPGKDWGWFSFTTSRTFKVGPPRGAGWEFRVLAQGFDGRFSAGANDIHT